MAYDIHGNHLTPGHCEVHPHVSEPYPCWICRAQDDAERDAYSYQQDQYRELENAYYRSANQEDAHYRAQEEQVEDDRIEAEQQSQNGGSQ